MAVRPVQGLLMSLLLYELTSGDYCRNEDNSSLQFCQSGIISGSRVYINGSSVKTKEDLLDRGCECHLEQTGNSDILVATWGSCEHCGLQMRIGDAYLKSNYYASQTSGWGSITLTDSKFTMILSLDGSTESLNTAFCITIKPNQPDSSVVLNLTCEELVARPSTAISTSPNVITTPPTMVLDTMKSMSPTSTENAKPSKIETTIPAVITAGNTNGTHGPKANNTTRVTTTTTTTTTTGNDPGEPRLHSQKEELLVGAAVGGSCGGVVLVIVITVIIFICYKRRLKNKYMQRQSTAPARVYTELEFGSRDGQNESHVYSAIEPQQIYSNNV